MSKSCFKPATFEFVSPSTMDKEELHKGVPQVTPYFLADRFHAPPAAAVSNEVFTEVPPSRTTFRIPTLSRAKGQQLEVQPVNFESLYVEYDHGDSKQPSKQPVERERAGGRSLS